MIFLDFNINFFKSNKFQPILTATYQNNSLILLIDCQDPASLNLSTLNHFNANHLNQLQDFFENHIDFDLLAADSFAIIDHDMRA